MVSELSPVQRPPLKHLRGDWWFLKSLFQFTSDFFPRCSPLSDQVFSFPSQTCHHPPLNSVSLRETFQILALPSLTWYSIAQFLLDFIIHGGRLLLNHTHSPLSFTIKRNTYLIANAPTLIHFSSPSVLPVSFLLCLLGLSHFPRSSMWQGAASSSFPPCPHWFISISPNSHSVHECLYFPSFLFSCIPALSSQRTTLNSATSLHLSVPPEIWQGLLTPRFFLLWTSRLAGVQPAHTCTAQKLQSATTISLNNKLF